MIKLMSNQKGFAPILILAGVIVILGLAGGTFYLGKLTTSKPQPPAQVITSPSPVSSLTPSPVVSPVADETANWKTYTSTQYAYLIQYPTNFTMEAGSKSIQPPPDVTFSFPKDPKRDYYFFGVSISVLSVPRNFSINQAIDQVASRYYSVKNIKFQPIKIAELDGLASEVPAAYYGYDAFLLNDGKLYVFELSGNPGNSAPNDEKNTFDQILSTFKFLDNNPESYTCPVNGWQNCMPILSEEAKKGCGKEAVDWYKANCPNFQGIAQ